MNYLEFTVGDLLYKGDVSDIWQGVHVETNTEVHFVIVNKKLYGHLIDQERMARLVPIVGEVNHINVLKYHKIVESDAQIGVVMEHPQVCGAGCV
jgi:hypothetical protein